MKKEFIEGEILKGYEVLEYTMNCHYPSWDTQGREESGISKRINEDIYYILTKVKITSIEEPTFYIDEDTVKEYMKMDIKTMPPIVLEIFEDNYFIVDGCHRFYAVKDLKLETILAYIPIMN